MGIKKFKILVTVVVLLGFAYLIVFQGLWGIKIKNSTPQANKDNYVEGYKEEGHYGVSAGHPLAVEVGMNVLKQGGNAVDAAIAVSYVLGVVESYGSGIGGGGAMLIYPTDGKAPVVFDYRETMPFSGKMPKGYIGVPGLVKGMEEVHKEFGSMDIKTLIDPAIKLAEEGAPVSNALANRISGAQYRMSVKELPNYYPYGRPISEGSLLKQKALADTLRTIRDEGAKGFYEGTIANRIVEKVKGIEIDDLKKYSVVKRVPVEGEFKGYKILSAPPPLSGIMLIEMLQMAESVDFNKVGLKTADYAHLIGEMSRISYNDHLTYDGDPAFTDIPVEKLTSKAYAKELISKIVPDKLIGEHEYIDTPADEADHNNTTHFVVVDKSGMMVSATHTLSQFFGSGVYVDGFFLNNQLENFSSSKNSPNKPEPGKRPRSYLAPTILAKDGMPIMGIGSPGGKRIPIVLAQVMVRFFNSDQSIQSSIDESRFYFQGKTVFIEPGFTQEDKNNLRKKGYGIIEQPSQMLYGGVQSLYVDQDNGIIQGGADSRRGGSWKATQPMKLSQE